MHKHIGEKEKKTTKTLQKKKMYELKKKKMFLNRWQSASNKSTSIIHSNMAKKNTNLY